MFNAMIETLKANPRKIVFTEGPDARILEATARLTDAHSHRERGRSAHGGGSRRL